MNCNLEIKTFKIRKDIYQTKQKNKGDMLSYFELYKIKRLNQI